MVVRDGLAYGFTVFRAFRPRIMNDVAGLHDPDRGEREMFRSSVFKDIFERPQHHLLSQTRGQYHSIGEGEDLRSKYEWVGGFGG